MTFYWSHYAYTSQEVNTLGLSLKGLQPPLLDLQISRLHGFLLAAVLLQPWISSEALEGRTLSVITVWYRVRWGRHQLGICSCCT